MAIFCYWWMSGDPIEVAKVILKAAISENPDSRYLVGDDALKLMNMRKNTFDENFRHIT